MEQWQTVFEAAGFSNAIIALDAASPSKRTDKLYLKEMSWRIEEMISQKNQHSRL